MGRTINIPMTDRAPVEVNSQEWPVLVELTDDSFSGDDDAKYQQASTQGQLDEYTLGVRKHADGRCIVYCRLEATIAECRQPADGVSWHGGTVVAANEDVVQA